MAMLSATCCFAAAVSCGLNSGTSPLVLTASTASVLRWRVQARPARTGLAPRIFPLVEGGSIRKSGVGSSAAERSPCATGGFGRTTYRGLPTETHVPFRSAQPLSMKIAAQHKATCVACCPHRSIPKHFLTRVAVVIRQPVAIRIRNRRAPSDLRFEIDRTIQQLVRFETR